MNTGNIKKYAPRARTRFIETMTRQAARYGITKERVAPAEVRGDVMLISALDGQTHSFSKALRGPREALAKWVTQLGFEQAMEQAAYSWLNRLCAIRFMELKGYLDHGRRVLSHPDHEGGFQILDDCLEIDLPGLDTTRVRELKLDGTQDEALYRELLLAQCHALHEAIPFLFEPLDDASELLLPDNLTKTDSLIRELVEAIPEEDWQDVEVIGWLYQFYIAEKKGEVIGKVVKSEDIPAATQLFTPNWIVQYLVQNSVGRQWLQTYPDSPLKGEMPYYIEPAEQEPEVQAQLDAITPASIDPETIKVLDPACGSGHILVEAYNVLKAIYEERGYRSRDIPKLILESNLFGLDIDDRAAQLAGFALLMKAREDDRRIFTRGIRLNVMALQSSQYLDVSTLWRNLNLTGDWHQGQSQSLFEGEQKELSSNDNTYKVIVDLIERFQDAKTFGSLIEVPNSFEALLKTLLEDLTELSNRGDTIQKTAAKQLMPVVQQACILANSYNSIVANPPYMGSSYFEKSLKKELSERYKTTRTDLYAIFIERNAKLTKDSLSTVSMVTRQDWMHTSSYSDLRGKILKKWQLNSLVQLGSGGFPSLSGEVVQAAAFIFNTWHVKNYKQVYVDCTSKKAGKEGLFKGHRNRFDCSSDRFPSSLGNPVLYFLKEEELNAFSLSKSFGEVVTLREGVHTGDNEAFIRFWWEVSEKTISKECMSVECFDRGKWKWAPYNKGGTTSRWYDPTDFVLAYDAPSRRKMEKIKGHVRPSQSLYFKEGGTWSDVATKGFGVRYYEEGHLFDGAGPVVISENIAKDISIMNSLPFRVLCAYAMPNLHFKCGTIKKMPYPELGVAESERIAECGCKIIACLKAASSYIETNRLNFSHILVKRDVGKIEEKHHEANAELLKTKKNIENLEREVNETVSLSYGLGTMLYDEPSLENNVVSKIKDNGLFSSLVSYVIGCMMGRYSPDKPGLILASQGETIHDYLAQIPEPSFVPDKNAIIPLTDQEWFPDDATNRFRDFVRTGWGEEHLQENLDFVSESLCLHAIKPKKGEAALDTIRRYLSTQFYKDHLRTYKKRPIYWLFSSGKQKAFECLVYLHRYNESTLAEMRTDYVIPLTTRLASYVEKLEQDKEASTSAAEAKSIEKELDKLYKQQAELNAFDEKLRHYADQRVSLDLDDGVKVNYGKFGDLLANVKEITGSKSE
ncbi:BREX-1 system adenine-specific DNA-methyltransferase PglX [Kushneria marisflavi]|uniref:site-specific DNA-methyltransferase (adenine-specific) n=1 Tax=Kushneria marisflavi TaxID=157779 RepID=A0A240USA2_9GAMM|nr:BREX-1 system adenine-specific DNA-methyltransferase PglX [Kushneria marisflavi]ART64016.1 SAM-dependent methyltransferase [Kushneria marisflavi]RKD85745.1 Eco57I restriction-modification methylase [Kushneria marisflavi]